MDRPTETGQAGPLGSPENGVGPRVELEIVRGRARNKRRPVAGKAYLIGAAEDCDLVLGDPQFPQVAAYVLRGPQGVSIRWLGVGPELTINGQVATESTVVADQDLVRMGPYEFRFHIAGLRRPPIDGREQNIIPAPHSRAFAGRMKLPPGRKAVWLASQTPQALRLFGLHPQGKAAS